MAQVPTITLNDGRAIPQLGIGVWQVSTDDIVRQVGEAQVPAPCLRPSCLEHLDHVRTRFTRHGDQHQASSASMSIS